MSANLTSLRILRGRAAMAAFGLILAAPAQAQGGMDSMGERKFPPTYSQGMVSGTLVMPAEQDGSIEGYLLDEAERTRFEFRGRLIQTHVAGGGEIRRGRVVGLLFDASVQGRPAATVLGSWIENVPGRGRIQAAIYRRARLEYPQEESPYGHLLVGTLAGEFMLEGSPLLGSGRAKVGGSEQEELFEDPPGISVSYQKLFQERWVGGPPIHVLSRRSAQRIAAMVAVGERGAGGQAGGNSIGEQRFGQPGGRSLGEELFEEPRGEAGLWLAAWKIAH